MPFGREVENKERLLAAISDKIREIWGKDISEIYPVLIARAVKDGTSFELTPVLRDDASKRVVLNGSNEEEYLTLSGGGLYGEDKPKKMIYEIRSSLVKAIFNTNREARGEQLRQIRQLKEYFRWNCGVFYLFDTFPLVPGVGQDARVYLINFFDPQGSMESGLLRCYYFLAVDGSMDNLTLAGDRRKPPQA